MTSCCRYNIVFFLVTYLLPMLGMVICYLQMGVNLWRTDSNIAMTASAHPALIKSRQNKKRVILYFKYKARLIPQPSAAFLFLFIGWKLGNTQSKNHFQLHILLTSAINFMLLKYKVK